MIFLNKLIVVTLILFSNNLCCQKQSLNFNRNEKRIEIHAGDSIGYARILYQEGKRKKGRQILKDVIIAELSNTKIRDELHNTYAITAAESLIKIDYLAGVDYLLKLYRYFEQREDTYSKRNYYGITNMIKNWTKRKYEPGYEIIEYLEEKLDSLNGRKNLDKGLRKTQEIDSIRFYSFSMGGGFDIMMSEKVFIYQRGSWNSGIVKEPQKMDQLEWKKLLTKLGKINLEAIPGMKQPPGSRNFDGANYSTLTIYMNREKFVSKDFDDFRPSKELEPVVHYIRYLLRKKLNY